MAMIDRRFVLISESGYSSQHDQFLATLLDEGYELFSVVGKDCELWEEIMDEIAVGNGSNVRYITTTSHVGETVEDVIEFAKNWSTEKSSGVKVVSI